MKRYIMITTRPMIRDRTQQATEFDHWTFINIVIDSHSGFFAANGPYQSARP